MYFSQILNSLVAQDVILQPGQHGLASSYLLIFTQGQSEGRGNPQKIGVVAIFITGGNLIDPWTNDLD